MKVKRVIFTRSEDSEVSLRHNEDERKKETWAVIQKTAGEGAHTQVFKPDFKSCITLPLPAEPPHDNEPTRRTLCTPLNIIHTAISDQEMTAVFISLLIYLCIFFRQFPLCPRRRWFRGANKSHGVHALLSSLKWSTAGMFVRFP